MSTRYRSLRRRDFLKSTAGVSAAVATTAFVPGNVALANDAPQVKDPRATSGDTAHEPDWQQRLAIRVGQNDGDVRGNDHRAIQAAVDYVAHLGGGTVEVLPGEYTLRNSVFLRSGVRLVGAGADTVLYKPASHRTELAADSDWYDQEITLADASRFEVGDGVCLVTKNPHNGATDVLKRTLIARSGNRFKLDRPLRKNYWLMGDSTAASLYPLVTAENATDMAIENLTLDGNQRENDNLNGNYGGAIFFQDVARVTIRNVEARQYNGDGMSWQISHDVTVESCYSHDNANLGLHPGSGSQRPRIRDNRLERNNIGIFFCWGVKYGLAENNRMDGNRQYGVSIGHRDTDNLIRGNEIRHSGISGVLFRPERGKDFAPHRNRLVANTIVDNGPADGVAVDVQGITDAVTIRENRIEESRAAMNRTGLRIGAQVTNLELRENHIGGFATSISDQRAST